MSAALSGWRLSLLCAGLWALGVVLAETPTLPVSDLTTSDLAMFCCQSFMPWLGAGLVWSIGTRMAEDHDRWILLPLLPLATLVAVMARVMVSAIEPRLATSTGEFLRDVPLADSAPYLVWSNLFYGYLYVAGYLVALRGMRGRTLLAVQRRERSEVDSNLREARLSSLRGQLQPDLLIEALRALQTHFAGEAAEGNRLFNFIVAFLRGVMPGVRNETSFLGAELKTVRRYSVLREMLGQSGVRLGAIAPGAADLAFPPLLLLPLVDLLTHDRYIEVMTDSAAGRYTIAMIAAAPRVPIAEALDALDAGVATVGGDVVVSRDASTIEIRVSLPLLVADFALPIDTTRSINNRKELR